MIIVHHLEKSRSESLVWFLEEHGLDYDIKTYARNPKTNLAPDAYKALHPLGKAPIIEDKGDMLVETAAVMDTLMDRYGAKGLRPRAKTKAFEQYRYWMHAAEGSLMPFMVMSLLMTQMETKPPAGIKHVVRLVTGKLREMYLAPSTDNMLSFVNQTLEENAWFAGHDFSAADIIMGFPLSRAIERTDAAAKYPAIKAFVEKAHARSAFNAAKARFGK